MPEIKIMDHPKSQIRARLASRLGSRSGFSFTEVLFAVMILGIGFIMIAGIFPVAISQTASSQEETAGAALLRHHLGRDFLDAGRVGGTQQFLQQYGAQAIHNGSSTAFQAIAEPVEEPHRRIAEAVML